jgi:hypothetical protein
MYPVGFMQMIRTKYRSYTICQQREFGPLRFVKWIEEGDFIIVQNSVNLMPGTTLEP